MSLIYNQQAVLSLMSPSKHIANYASIGYNCSSAYITYMQKIIFLLTTITSFFIFTPFSYAVTVCPGNDFQNLCSIDLEKNSNFIGNIFTLLLTGSVLLSLGFLIWGGIKWITSGGDKSKVDGARGAIVAAIVGLVVSFLAFSIVNLVTYVFGVKGTNGLEIPRLVNNR